MLTRQAIEDIMYGRKSSPLIGALLFFASLIYGFAVRLRLAAYEHGFLRIKKLPCPVISVGNLTLGGTGKTPAVIAIAAFLGQQGMKTAVVSRGYGRREESPTVVVSDGTGILVDPSVSGDEPALMAARLQDVPVIVGKDRFNAGSAAITRFRPDVLVLDDGFQHIRLHRDLNIVLLDGRLPFGNGKLFPAGVLREPVGSLRRADVVLITRSEQASDLSSLRSRIARITPAPVFTAKHVPTDLVGLMDDSRESLASLQGASVLAFSGIAKPESFASLLSELGADVRKVIDFPDHYQYAPEDLERLRSQARESGAPLIVTTEKDGVKLREIEPRGIRALRIQLEILEKEAWERVLLQRL